MIVPAFALGCVFMLCLVCAAIVFLVDRELDSGQSRDMGDYPAVPDALIEEARRDAAQRGAEAV